MQKHTKIYLDYFGYSTTDYIECEACNAYRAVDIHHIEARGMGGSKSKDTIENLMAVCRKCHERYGDKKEWKDWLKSVHSIHLKNK